jgi:predicted PurR-regulated permease PerM
MKDYPLYLKSTVILLGLVLLSYVLFTLAGILIPIAFAVLIGILLNPLSNRLQRWGTPPVLAISLTILLAFLVFSGIGYFFVQQLAGFSNELPALKTKSTEIIHQLQTWSSHTFGLDMKKQQEMTADIQKSVKPFLEQMVGSIASALGLLFLIPVYVFLIMFYKNLLLDFIYDLCDRENSKEVAIVLTETKSAVQNYMVGLMLEALVVATLNVVALLLLGVKYALLLGVAGAVINVLPYIGGIVAVLLPVVIATVTKDGYQTQLGIVAAYALIQFIDNHFLVPYIVSSKVKINALVSIVIVLLGGMLWGVAGMFLSIPFIGVLKIVFDRVPELKVWGKLLGDEVPTQHAGQKWGAKKKRAAAKG